MLWTLILFINVLDMARWGERGGGSTVQWGLQDSGLGSTSPGCKKQPRAFLMGKAIGSLGAGAGCGERWEQHVPVPPCRVRGEAQSGAGKNYRGCLELGSCPDLYLCFYLGLFVFQISSQIP